MPDKHEVGGSTPLEPTSQETDKRPEGKRREIGVERKEKVRTEGSREHSKRNEGKTKCLKEESESK